MGEPLNCWDYMLCGRESGGTHTNDLGLCQAAKDERFNGIHGGINAGRACWVVASTVLKGSNHCTFAKHGNNCGMCDFYKIVRKEEGNKLCPTFFLFKMVEEKIS